MALHPGALLVLSDAITEASRRRQILITTQSPDLIDNFEVDSLRVVTREAGTSRVGMVDRMQREVVQSLLFTSGELMRSEGLQVATSPKAASPSGSDTIKNKRVAAKADLMGTV